MDKKAKLPIEMIIILIISGALILWFILFSKEVRSEAISIIIGFFT